MSSSHYSSVYFKFVCALLLVACTIGLPLKYDIIFKSKFCLVESFESDEYVTFAVSIDDGPKLKARMSFAGPIGSNTISTAALKKNIDFDQPKNLISFSEDVDFEETSPSRPKLGDPWIGTRKVSESGIYKLCVDNNKSGGVISAKIDIRKGIVDTVSGHIPSFETRSLLENLSFKKDDNSDLQFDKNEAVKLAEEKLLSLRKALSHAKQKQMNYMDRLDFHKSLNEHTHSRMVVRSLWETVIFIAVTGYQVYLIRKWFSSAGSIGMLGSPVKRPATFY